LGKEKPLLASLPSSLRLDLQTDTVWVSSMIYTQGTEIYTSLSVQFEIDDSGSISALPVLKSFIDLKVLGRVTTFIAMSIVTLFFACLGLIQSCYLVCCGQKENSQILFEFFSRIVLVAYMLWLLVGSQSMKPMSEEYYDLLDTFLTLEKFNHHNMVA
jgi:hypothetical protein